MAKRFRPVDRDQPYLLAPDMREWLPAGHLVWFVIDVVGGLDLAVFRARRPLGGAGRAAFDPQMMLALLVYAYAVGQRSSRQIERLCHTDVAFRIVCAQDVPDHVTIARFRAEHEQALAGLFEQVLLVCARAGMGRVGTVALDGTKIGADAALSANRSESGLRRLAKDILDDAGAVDAGEDGLFGAARGDELPAELADPCGRAARIKQILDDLAAERGAKAESSAPAKAARRRVEHARDALARTRERVAERNAERERWEQIIRAEGGAGLSGTMVAVDDHYDVRMAAARLVKAEDALAKTLDKALHPALHPAPAETGTGREVKRNLTDPDSRIMPTHNGWVQGYNCQIVVSSDYLILAADITTDTGDMACYQPMITQSQSAARAIRRATGRRTRIGTVLADAGYASTANLTAPGPDRLIALSTRHNQDDAARSNPTHGPPPPDATTWQQMDHRLRTPAGASRYRRRGAIVEPVHAHLKDRRGLRRFSRRGLDAARAEHKFGAAVTNLLRLTTQQSATA